MTPAAALVPAHLPRPGGLEGQARLLHFGAVDWEATVRVNGKRSARTRAATTVHLRHHRRPQARRPAGARRRRCAIRPTRATQPRGKQVLEPERHLVHADHRHLADGVARAGARRRIERLNTDARRRRRRMRLDRDGSRRGARATGASRGLRRADRRSAQRHGRSRPQIRVHGSRRPKLWSPGRARSCTT